MSEDGLLESLAQKPPRLPCSGQQPPRGAQRSGSRCRNREVGRGPGAGPCSAGTLGKFVCVHSCLQSLEAPSVHPERMSHSCFPGWSALRTVSLKGQTGSKHPALPDCPLWGREPWADAGGQGWAHPGCTGPPGPLAAGPRPLPSRRTGPRRGGAWRADRQL